MIDDVNEGEPAVRLSGVRKTYQVGEPVDALDGVTLDVPDGSYTAIMGPSGSGKSTLMNIMGVLDMPTDGTVEVGSEDVSELSAAERTRIRREQVGFVFQQFNLMPRLTAAQNVALPMVFRGVSRSARRERAADLLEQVGLGDRGDHLPRELSGGQRQRVAIARGLSNDPTILLADEPTGNLDTETGEVILGVFEELHEDDRTIVVVTHEEHVADHADRVVHLVDGTVRGDEDISSEKRTAAEVIE